MLAQVVREMRSWAFGVFTCVVSSTNRVHFERADGTLAVDTPPRRGHVSRSLQTEESVRSSQTVTRAEEIDRKTGRFWAALEVAMLPVEKAPYHEPVDLKHDESLSRLLIALNLSAVFIAVFLVRCYLGADLTSLAVEMVQPAQQQVMSITPPRYLMK